MTHFISAVLFTVAACAGGFCLGFTVRAHQAAIGSALRGEWYGPRGSGR